MKTLVMNCKVLQGDNPPSDYKLEWKDVVIEGERIARVVDQGTACLDGYYDYVIDGKNSHVLLPGLVDNHIHSRVVNLWVHHNWEDPSLKPVGREQCKYLLMEAYREAVSAGTTILMDYPEYVFDPEPGKDGFDLPLECMRNVGISGIVRLLLSHDKEEISEFGNLTLSRLVCRDLKRIDRVVGDYGDKGFKFAIYIPEESRLFDENGAFIGYAEKKISFLKELYRRVQHDDVYFVMHCAETKERVEKVIAAGYKHTIDFLVKNGLLGQKTVLVHCLYGIDGYVRVIRDSGARVVVRPKIREYGGIPVACPVSQFYQNKVSIGLGSDVPLSRGGIRRGFWIIPEILRAVDIYGGIDFNTALYIAIDGGSKVFGFEGVGRVEQEYIANLVMVDIQTDIKRHEIGEEKAYSINDLKRDLNTQAVKLVLSNGRIIYPRACNGNSVCCDIQVSEVVPGSPRRFQVNGPNPYCL